MKYNQIVEATFVFRPNRFVAEVSINGIQEDVHVKNTGRCKEILVASTKVYLEKSTNPNRKTNYSLVSAYKGPMLINIDSQAPNQVVFEALKENRIRGFEDLRLIARERFYGNSRFDIYYERNDGKKGYIEVKGVTLEVEGLAMFPDAPTERGTKHIEEMVNVVREGYEGSIFFLIQMAQVKNFSPNFEMDPKFSNSLRKAYESGVKVLVYNSYVTKDEIILDKEGFYCHDD
ncbi:MAG: DNA/RNA nuclease SfsA [Eubacteriales bacterium]|nr:DNA/RNA nuclease SfsA [Eubacteriales bacterium]